ncbi:hypothetical protein JHL18_05805 [Clostridium sp. YIM B02505]|uniref:Lipoprotein n=1 Tax=Clostridium yunnanense TaxID=2800325 RepID=A0ABS1ELE4_9CLOT|nr:hypothetical protein [Clostridium yunnanense]MBK1810160.1 hypothetical protein [Clostridium yunnanense]
MRTKSILFIIFSFAILLIASCSKPKNKEIIKPFNDIEVSSTKKVEFENMAITSIEKELGRSKMVTNSEDISKVADYLKTIECVSVNQIEKSPDLIISFIDNEDNHINSIVFSKNKIHIYKNSGTDTTELRFAPVDKKIIKELKNLYSSMNYEEYLLIKK